MANFSKVIRWGFANGGNASLFDFNEITLTPGNYALNCSGFLSSTVINSFLPSDLSTIITGALTGIQDGTSLPSTGVQNLNGFSIC